MATSLLHMCIVFLSLCFHLFLTPSALEAKENHPVSESATIGITQIPSYSILYEQLLLLERQRIYCVMKFELT